ncbi:MAG: 4Fe-4S dicluster domain-containing protein [Candidatus Korarchaeota archaeon]|nr:4Fe-4S dicluster domain-containing protein [Candidatus Korarchaeota archaeon]
MAPSESEAKKEERPIDKSRREFIKTLGVGAAALVVGAAAGYSLKTTEVVQKEVPVPVTDVQIKEVPAPEAITAKVFVLDYEKCVGCGICETLCALVNEGKANPEYSRIRVHHYAAGLISVPIVCIPCADKHCIEACPRGALSYNDKTGAIVLDDSKCNGCGLCVEACPAKAMFTHPETGKPMPCTKCGICATYCPTHAITPWSTILGFEEACARPPEEIARDRLLAKFGVETEEELIQRFSWTQEKLREFVK